MKAKVKVPFLVLSLFLFLNPSCSPEDGETGPAGPQGAQGPAGPQGAQGETGSPNVIYSDWFTVSQADWAGIGTTAIEFDLDVPDLTAEIEATGVVLVYHKFGGEARQLPYLYSGSQLYFGFTFIPLVLSIQSFDLDGDLITVIADVQFRYVLVPGGVPASGKSPVDFTKMSYYEAMDYFGIDY